MRKAHCEGTSASVQGWALGMACLSKWSSTRVSCSIHNHGQLTDPKTTHCPQVAVWTLQSPFKTWWHVDGPLPNDAAPSVVATRGANGLLPIRSDLPTAGGCPCNLCEQSPRKVATHQLAAIRTRLQRTLTPSVKLGVGAVGWRPVGSRVQHWG